MFGLNSSQEIAGLKDQITELKITIESLTKKLDQKHIELDDKIKQSAKYTMYQGRGNVGVIVALTSILSSGSILATLTIVAEGTIYQAALYKCLYIWAGVFGILICGGMAFFGAFWDTKNQIEAPWIFNNLKTQAHG